MLHPYRFNANPQITLLVVGTVTTGAANSLFTKYQDNQCVAFCDTDHPVLFEQPVLQTLQMFIGEVLCFVTYLAIKYRAGKPTARAAPEPTTHAPLGFRSSLLLAIPALCDITATTLMNVGLAMIPVSIYQMTRGSIILFVALFSVVFLHSRITRLEWSALLLVVLGVGVVGLAGNRAQAQAEVARVFTHVSTGSLRAAISASAQTSPETQLVAGMLFIFIAQVFTATQFVFEEYLLSRFTIEPVLLVGAEGLFGSAMAFAGMCVLHLFFAYGDSPTHGHTLPSLNMVLAFKDLFSSPAILVSSVCIMVSIAMFNFCGISITHRVSSTSRSTVDTSRTLLVWVVSLALRWERWSWLQASGFGLLVGGTLLFNKVVVIPERYLVSWLKLDRVRLGEATPLLI